MVPAGGQRDDPTATRDAAAPSATYLPLQLPMLRPLPAVVKVVRQVLLSVFYVGNRGRRVVVGKENFFVRSCARSVLARE